MQAHALIAMLILGTVLADIPVFFDARTQWSNCVGTTVYDQKTCASSLAHAIAGSVSDRSCIKNKVQIALSPQDIVCKFTGGCSTGSYAVATAFDYVNTVGLRNRACLPYTGDELAASCPENCVDTTITPTRTKCGTMTTLQGTAAIQTAIMTSGPVVCAFTETIDFVDYYEGVYYSSHTKQRYNYPSGAKLIGWGIENGMSYWIAENSLSDTFGENGFSRIKSSLCTVAYTCDSA